MAIVISISCDYSGCDEYAETGADITSGVNEIETALDDGWVHEGGSDYCPEHVDAADEEGLL